MATGQEQLTRLEYERELRGYRDDHELLIRLGLEVYDIKDNYAKGGSRKQSVTLGAGSGGITALIFLIIDYLFFKIKGG
ncbi:MAG: hypothetical protein PHQ43_05715 [Dehalococcoidales bacterium]|nr:hypothetical protein [Dehalococcoidales bacterium]